MHQAPDHLPDAPDAVPDAAPDAATDAATGAAPGDAPRDASDAAPGDAPRDASDAAPGDTPDAPPGDPRAAALLRREAVRARRAMLSGSGLFDPDWYLARTPAAAGSDLDPLDHYRAHGVRQVAAPGPLFDPEDYLRRAWHLRRGIDDPLEHFLERGGVEALEARSLPSDDAHGTVPGRVVPGHAVPGHALPGHAVRPFRLLGRSACAPTLAVSVHVFHPEAFEEICAALRLLPYRFSLLVTVVDETHEAVVRACVERHRLDARLLVRACANRGRNFGPMLVRFRDAILAHELVLHLHTKRSLHHPGGLDGWRRELLRTLLPATAVVRGLIAAFVDDPSLGVLTPSPSPEVRYWAYGWLRNRAAGRALFERLGSRATLPEGSFDYPAGGMFWARTKAIAALLEHPWREEDFPAERGQTDGTIAHAIERSILLVAAEAGYGFRELDARRGVVRLGWGSRNLGCYPEIGADALRREIDAAGIVSFDVFDTLLTRICLAPDAVHRFVGVAVQRRFAGATGYAALRRDAEIAARAARDDGEAGFDEIAACLAASAAGAGWSPAAIRFVLEEELALDARTLRPRSALSDAFRASCAAGRRTILVSDSVLTRPQFEAVLARFELGGLADAVYLSSERRARKDRGDLWQLVKASEPPALLRRLIHVGDNEQSDIQATADAGLRHAHVLSPAALFRLHGLLPASCEGDLAADILLGPAAEMLFNAPWPDAGAEGPVALRSAEQAGALLLGPLLFAFAAWLVRHPATRQLDTLFFVSREGYFLKRMFDAVVAEAGVEGMPRSHYFHCSRRVALGALQGGGLEVEPVLAGAGFNGSLSDLLLARLGFVADPSLGYDHVRIALPRDAGLVRCVMILMREPIEAHGRSMAHGLRAYAEAAGMTRGQGGPGQGGSGQGGSGQGGSGQGASAQGSFGEGGFGQGGSGQGGSAQGGSGQGGFGQGGSAQGGSEQGGSGQGGSGQGGSGQAGSWQGGSEQGGSGQGGFGQGGLGRGDSGQGGLGRGGFVDVGYSGTMQSALQAVLGTGLVGLYMGVSHAAAQVGAGGGHAFGAFADGDVAGFTGGYGQMLEAFLAAPHGQTIGYDTGGYDTGAYDTGSYDTGASPPVPLFRRDGHSQTVFPVLEQFYAGAERYAIALLRCWGPDLLALPFPADAATAMLGALRDGRLLLDPSLAGALSMEDDFCGNGEIPVLRARAGTGA